MKHIRFIHNPTPIIPMDLNMNMRIIIVLRTLSKSFGLAGLRIGFAVGPAGFN